MNKFERGKIYTIRSHKTDLVYVGSTTEKYLSNRMTKHRSNFKRYKNGKTRYCASFDIFDIDIDCYIELYEKHPCDSKLELDKREGQIIRSLDCVNKRIAGRANKEYIEDNKEKIKQYQKHYYQDNKEQIAAKSKQYRDNNPEYYKQYRVNNKDKLKAHRSRKYQCECGGKFTHSHKAEHMKSKKHQAFINQ